ncbi:MAG TPA: ABC transporter permease [Gaiellales bacterium]|nr:ABC transporter permease [Gaiellales bacterium]
MIRFVAARAGGAAAVLAAISLFVAFGIRLTGDPAVVLFQGSAPSTEDIARIRHALGTDRPFIAQYAGFVAGAVRGDLGTSFRSGQPVAGMILERAGPTIALGVGGMLAALAAAFPLGAYAATHRNALADFLIRVGSLLGLSFPNFWLAIMLILIVAVRLRWLPPSGYSGPASLVLPCATLGVILASTLVRLVRASLLDTLGQPYMRTARAKGLRESRVVVRHGLRNALLPVVTFVGLQFGALLGGVVVLENVFAWPGLGQLALQAVTYRDYPVVQGVVVVLALGVVLVNLLVDLSYGLLNPRVRVSS